MDKLRICPFLPIFPKNQGFYCKKISYLSNLLQVILYSLKQNLILVGTGSLDWH